MVKNIEKNIPKLSEYVSINKPTKLSWTSQFCCLQGNALAELMGPMERVRLSPGA